MALYCGPPYETFGRRRSLRLPGHDYSQPYAYHITWGTHRGTRLLSRELAECVASTLRSAASLTAVEIAAYCVMPDHVHVLLNPSAKGSVIRFVQVAKSLTAREYLARGGSGKLWQRGFYDHILRREEDVSAVARYIVGNPVRAGIVNDLASYPFAAVFTPQAPP